MESFKDIKNVPILQKIAVEIEYSELHQMSYSNVVLLPHLKPLRLVMPLGSVLSVLMLLKERSSQVRLVRPVMMVCLVRLDISLASPATELMPQLDNLTLFAPAP